MRVQDEAPAPAHETLSSKSLTKEQVRQYNICSSKLCMRMRVQDEAPAPADDATLSSKSLTKEQVQATIHVSSYF